MRSSRLCRLFTLSLLLVGGYASAVGPSSSPVPVLDEADRPRVRDPFWPVGYVPRKVVKPVVVAVKPGKGSELIPESARLPMWDEARRSLDIKGISMIGRDKESGRPRCIAMIGGRLLETGDVVSTNYEKRVYRWKILEIDKTGVVLQKIDVKSAE